MTSRVYDYGENLIAMGMAYHIIFIVILSAKVVPYGNLWLSEISSTEDQLKPTIDFDFWRFLFIFLFSIKFTNSFYNRKSFQTGEI